MKNKTQNMIIQKEDLINKIETLSGFLRHENKKKIDPEFYNDLCDEVDEFIEEIKNNEVEFIN